MGTDFVTNLDEVLRTVAAWPPERRRDWLKNFLSNGVTEDGKVWTPSDTDPASLIIDRIQKDDLMATTFGDTSLDLLKESVREKGFSDEYYFTGVLIMLESLLTTSVADAIATAEKLLDLIDSPAWGREGDWSARAFLVIGAQLSRLKDRREYSYLLEKATTRVIHKDTVVPAFCVVLLIDPDRAMELLPTTIATFEHGKVTVTATLLVRQLRVLVGDDENIKDKFRRTLGRMNRPDLIEQFDR